MLGTIRGNAPDRSLPTSNQRRLPRLRPPPLPPPRRRIRGTGAMSGAFGTRGTAPRRIPQDQIPQVCDVPDRRRRRDRQGPSKTRSSEAPPEPPPEVRDDANLLTTRQNRCAASDKGSAASPSSESSPPPPSSLERPLFPSSSSSSPRSSSPSPLLEALMAFSADDLYLLLTAAQRKRGQSLLSAIPASLHR